MCCLWIRKGATKERHICLWGVTTKVEGFKDYESYVKRLNGYLKKNLSGNHWGWDKGIIGEHENNKEYKMVSGEGADDTGKYSTDYTYYILHVLVFL